MDEVDVFPISLACPPGEAGDGRSTSTSTLVGVVGAEDGKEGEGETTGLGSDAGVVGETTEGGGTSAAHEVGVPPPFPCRLAAFDVAWEGETESDGNEGGGGRVVVGAGGVLVRVGPFSFVPGVDNTDGEDCKWRQREGAGGRSLLPLPFGKYEYDRL